MKTLSRLAVPLLCLLAPLSAGAQTKPNIVIFLLDDVGWCDSSVPFGPEVYPLNKRYRTPNLERLAREGMKFTNAYATPVCTSTRVSLMTGMNAAHTRVTNFANLVKDSPADPADDILKSPAWNCNGLSPVAGTSLTVHATAFPELLRDAGYYTIHVGKWHMATAGTPGVNPHNLGFLVNVAGNMAGEPRSYLSEDNYGNTAEKFNFRAVQDLAEYYGTGTFLTEALTREALKALEQPVRTKQPFFLYLSHYAAHLPMMRDPRFYRKYLEAGLDEGQARYAGLIEGIDKSLGDLMAFLDAHRVADNTVIIFMSDNGGQTISPGKGGQLHTHNLPLREGKGSVYEGGIREPMVVRWPGVVKPGSHTDQPVIIEDFFPTVLEIAGVRDAKPRQSLDGRSFVDLLTGRGSGDAERVFVWHYPNKWKPQDYPGINYYSAARQGDWKLVYSMKAARLELYNLREDIGEHHDVAAQNPERVRQLARLLGERLRGYDAQMPTVIKTGRPAPWPDQL